jgi:hypothetical protein
VAGFVNETIERLQKHLAAEFSTDLAATACSQTTRLPGLRYLKSPVTWKCRIILSFKDLRYMAVMHSAVIESKGQNPRSSSFSPGASWLFAVRSSRRRCQRAHDVEVDRRSIGLSVLRQAGWTVEDVDELGLTVELPERADIARVAATLIGAGLSLYQLRTWRQSLEDLFVSFILERQARGDQ